MIRTPSLFNQSENFNGKENLESTDKFDSIALRNIKNLNSNENKSNKNEILK